MKINFVAAAVASALAISSAPVMAQAVGQGQVEITGRIEAETCDISVDTPGGGPLSLRPVALQDVGEDGAGNTPFNVTFTGTDTCNGSGEFKFHNDGGFINSDGRLRNTAAGGATGIEIGIVEGATLLDLRSYKKENIAVSTGSVVTLPFVARYQKSVGGPSPTEGVVESTLQFTVVVN